MKTVAGLTPEIRQRIKGWQADWVRFGEEVFRLSFDDDQKAVIRSVQHNRRTVVKSGHARGKDFTAAFCSLAFLYLCGPCKVINTAPTGRQVKHIMMSEIEKMMRRSRIPLGGHMLDTGIRFRNRDWFLLGFKAQDAATEAWTGFHSERIMVVVTEASGIEQATFDAIEGLLTGDSRLLLVLNPNRTQGESYNAFKSPLYQKFTLSCLEAPNVKAKRTVIPGQVDWAWVNDLIQKPGWVSRIDAKDASSIEGDFEWEGNWYRPSDLFRVKVLGMWPKEPEGQLIPLAWVEAAHERWREWKANGGKLLDPLRLGADVAGMGNDLSCFCWRYGDIVSRLKAMPKQDHMSTVGTIKQALDTELSEAQASGRPIDVRALVDTIGEGAGVHSRLVELNQPSISVKFSEGALGLSDVTEQRKFLNMRAYCYWAIRDALDPSLGGSLALPLDDELTQDLTAPQFKQNSTGKILIEAKEDIKDRLGRSPDYGDALALSYYPRTEVGKFESGAFDGAGIW